MQVHDRKQQRNAEAISADNIVDERRSFVWLLSLLGLCIAVVLAYANSLNGPFIFDDQCIGENPHIQKLWPLSDVLFRAPPDTPPAGRPVVALSLAINYAIGGLDVRGYHIFNIAVHLASVLVLWGVVRRTLLHTPLSTWFGLSAPFLAFAIALIWGVHPLLTESVSYVSQRTELLMGLFYLLTLYCAIRSWQAGGNRLWTVAAIAACAIGMGCKEAMVSAPLIVLLYDVTLVSSSLREAMRRHASLYIGLAATWFLLAWLNISGPRSLTCGAEHGLSRLDYLRTQADIIVWYLRLCFWPHPLVISYEDWPLARSFMSILPQGLLIVALLALTARGIWRRHPAAILGTWFFAILAPTSSFVPIVTEIAAERRMYLPLAAVVITVVLACSELLRLAKQRLALSNRATASIAAIALLLASSALAYGTVLRNRDYHTEIGIWSDALANRPNNPQALCNLARVLLAAGQNENAVYYCSRAIELRKDRFEIFNIRGRAFAALGNLDGAIEDYTRAIELKPDMPDTYYNRGMAFGAKRAYSQAIEDFTQCLKFKPAYAEAYYNRGLAYDETGQSDPAIQDYSRAIELKPDYALAYNNRGNTYNKLNDFDRAIRDYTKAVELKPNNPIAYCNRSICYIKMKDYNRARVDAEKCGQLGGRVPSTLFDNPSKSAGGTPN